MWLSVRGESAVNYMLYIARLLNEKDSIERVGKMLNMNRTCYHIITNYIHATSHIMMQAGGRFIRRMTRKLNREVVSTIFEVFE